MSEQDELITRAAHPDDDLALRQLIAVPMTTRGVMLSFQREPSYFGASKVIYKVNDHAVVENATNKQIVAVYSNGYRPCYIDGAVKSLRYASDLRVAPNYRGKAVLLKLSAQMRATMQTPNYSHTIIFNDNYTARAAIQTSKTNMPGYYDEGLIETLTLTGFRRAELATQVVQLCPRALTLAKDLPQIKARQATPADVPAMNALIKHMAQHYNYIPAYDFHELLIGDNYFQGLTIEDFQLYEKNGELLGMFGLWRQSAFKQSKILNYGPLIAALRPIYNLWASWTGHMALPKRGESFKYHALHSLLCHPHHLGLHDRMLRDAYLLSQQRGVGCISYTVSHQDPRQALNQCYKGELLVGMHGFISYEGNPMDSIDPRRIPFLEVGRI